MHALPTPPACLQVDGVSSIGALDFRMDDWGVDVAVTGSQKAMSLPTGLCYVAASKKVCYMRVGQACSEFVRRAQAAWRRLHAGQRAPWRILCRPRAAGRSKARAAARLRLVQASTRGCLGARGSS